MDVLKLKVEVLLVLEGRVSLHNEWTQQGGLSIRLIAILLEPARRDRRSLVYELLIDLVEIKQDFALIDEVVDVLHLSDGLLAESFQGDEFLLRLAPGLVDLAEVADADDFVDVEVSDLRLWILPRFLGLPD